MVLLRICQCGVAFGVVVGFGPSWPRAFRFATRYRSLSPGGESKGEGPQPRPFESFQRGVGETGEAPPVADGASLFRGSGAIGGPKGAGNRNAATVLKLRPRMFTRGLPTPFPLGVGKGEGPQPLPFESFGGCGGESKRPHVSGGGARGRGLCAKDLSPSPRPRRGRRVIRDHPSRGAYSYTGARPGHGTAPRWGWCGCGFPPPPARGW